MDVPYRCPRCGDGRTFHVLSDLKQHLATDHSYVPTPRKRVQVFNGSKGDNSGRFSPLLQSFHDEGKRLERELQEARDLEMNNKLKRYGKDGQNSLDRSDLVRSVGAEFVKPSIVSFKDDHLKNTLNTLTQEVSISRQNQWKTTDALIRADEVLSNVERAAETKCSEQRSVIEKLREELKVKEDDLKNSEEELDRLKKEQNQLIESAEILSRKTNEESQRLSEELEAKEVLLSRINSQLAHLRQNSLEDWSSQVRQGPSWKSEKDAKNMKMERNMLNEREAALKRQTMKDDTFDHVQAKRFHGLQHEARGPHITSHGYRNPSFDEPEQDVEELDLLSQELRKMQRDAVHKMQEKDKELIQAKKRSDKLEQDRLMLLHEMENLLSKANSNNEKLKSELKHKEDELKEFNTNLQDAKNEQSKLVGETFELYRQADKNIAKLKEMLTLKDFQLKAANEKLNQFQIANEHLLAESESIAQHADEKGNIMQTMLHTTEQNLQKMEKELNETKYEKEKLKEEAENLRQEVAERSRSLIELQQEVDAKEKELEKTNDDLKTLQTFLQTTAAKESEARKELEAFIMELIGRADKAEKELRTLKRQMRAASLAKASDESQSVASTHIPVSLHKTLTEPVIHTTTSQLASSIGQGDVGIRSQLHSSAQESTPTENRPRKTQESSHTRTKTKSPRKTEPHFERSSQIVAPISPREESSGKNVLTNSGQDGTSDFEKPQEVDFPRMKRDYGEDNEASLISGVSSSDLLVEPMVSRERTAVSDRAMQTDTTDVMGSHQSENLCDSCQNTREMKKESCEDSVSEQFKATGVSEQQRHPEKVGESVTQARTKSMNTKSSPYECPTCSDPGKTKEAETPYNGLDAVPVPIHSSTPKKSSKKPGTECRHCHHITQNDSDSGESDLVTGQNHPKEKTLESARAAVLARIMADEARRSNQLPQEERMWYGLESDPRLMQQANAVPRKDLQAGLKGRGIPSGFLNNFDRIRHPRTMQYVYSDSPTPSFSSIRHDINPRQHRLPVNDPQRFESRVVSSASPRYMTGDIASQLSKEKSQNKLLSDRIEKLEKVVSESKSVERLDKILNEVITDSSRISMKEDIQKLRESIGPRPIPERKRNFKQSVERSDVGRASGTPASTSAGLTQSSRRLADTDPFRLSPQSSDSYTGLPSSTDRHSNRPPRDSMSQSYSTYHSSEPGLIIRNEFYGKPSQATPQARPELLSHPKVPSPNQHILYSGNPVLKQFDQRPVTADGMAYSHPQLSPQYSGSQYYEHFPRRIYPQDLHSPYQQYSQSHVLVQRPAPQLNSVTGAPYRASDQNQPFQQRHSFGQEHENRLPETPKKTDADLYSPILTTDSDVSGGMELSVDENGILWDEEQADTTFHSEDLDSFRLSPSGSETAGDVDSSLLLSGSGSQPAPGKSNSHKQILEEIAETDEESLYCELPGHKAKKGQGSVSNSRDVIGVRSSGQGFRTDKGGMISDIVSVKDKMMKYLDEDDLKDKRYSSQTPGNDRYDTKGKAGRKAKGNKPGGLNNSSTATSVLKQPRNAETSSGVIHNRLDSKASNLTFSVDTDGDHSSSSYTPIKPPASKSRFRRSDSFDLELDNNPASDVKVVRSNTGQNEDHKPSRNKVYSKKLVDDGRKPEVVEESIQPQSKTRDKSCFNISQKLNLLSSSSESLDRSPRRKPVAKKRAVRGDKNVSGATPTGTCQTDGNLGHAVDTTHSRTVVKADVHDVSATPEKTNLPGVENSNQQQQVPGSFGDVARKPNPESFDNRDSVLGTSIGSDPVDDIARYENTSQTNQKEGMFQGKEESGLTSSLDSLDDLAKYENVPLKKAEPLHPTFADEATTDDERSRGSIQDYQGASAAVHKEESTDFDFESDLERFGTPLTLSKSGQKGKGKKTKVLTHKKARGASANRRLSIPKLHPDESGDAASDASKANRHRQEAAKRRRVALFCVFRCLDTKTLSQMALVCREWRHVCRHPELWKRVELKNERISSSFLVTISQWCSRLQHLRLEGLQCRPRQPNESIEEYEQNTRASLESGLEELLKCCQDSLISLQIIACGNILTNKCLWLASCYCRLLETLHYVSSEDTVTAEVLWAIGGGCPGVTQLVIPPLYPSLNPSPMSFNNKCLLLIAKFYPDLLELGIGGQEISIGGLLPLIQGCQRLQYLQLDHVPELTSDDVTALCRAGLRHLSVLELNGSPITPDAVKQIYKSCRHLKRLRILLNFHNYFEDASKKKNKEEYKKKIQKLQDLLKQPGLGNVLKLHADPME